ncbi:MAG: DUF2752 domain-containing protein [Flavobacteriaceae bacterium]|nr:DUF2752 domain-containing protein [Flavobacteriaceae bacterium]
MIYKLLSIIGFFILGGGIYYFYQNDPAQSETVFILCVTKNISGVDCPGCGSQRAFHELLHGNFIKAAKLNLTIYFFTPLLLFLFLKTALKPFRIDLPDLLITTKRLMLILFFLLLFTVLRNLI